MTGPLRRRMVGALRGFGSLFVHLEGFSFQTKACLLGSPHWARGSDPGLRLPSLCPRMRSVQLSGGRHPQKKVWHPRFELIEFEKRARARMRRRGREKWRAGWGSKRRKSHQSQAGRSWVHGGGHKVRDKRGRRHDGWQGRASRQGRSQLSGRNLWIEQNNKYLSVSSPGCAHVGVYARLHFVPPPHPAVFWDVCSPLATCEMFCLQALIIRLVYGVVCIGSPRPPMIYASYFPLMLVLFAAACYSSRTQMWPRRRSAVQGFRIDFGFTRRHFLLLFLYNIRDPGLTRGGLDNAKGERSLN